MNFKIAYVDSELLYNNRHLFTDDVQYNSLVLSNLTNQNLQLVPVKTFVEYIYSSSEKHEVFQSLSVNSINFIYNQGLINYNKVYRQVSYRYITWNEITLESLYISLLIRYN